MAKKRTYKSAQADIQTILVIDGWAISAGHLKVRHCTSKCGKYRIWFKAQAILFSCNFQVDRKGCGHELGNARSFCFDDIRAMSARETVNEMYRFLAIK